MTSTCTVRSDAETDPGGEGAFSISNIFINCDEIYCGVDVTIMTEKYKNFNRKIHRQNEFQHRTIFFITNI